MDQLEGEPRLELRLVEAGKGAPRVGRLELRRGVALLAAERAVQAAERVPDPALPGDLESVLARRDLAGEAKRRGLGLAVEGDTFERRLVDRCAVDVQVDRVKDDLAGRTRRADLDPLIAGRRPTVEVELENKPVAARKSVLR